MLHEAILYYRHGTCKIGTLVVPDGVTRSEAYRQFLDRNCNFVPILFEDYDAEENGDVLWLNRQSTEVCLILTSLGLKCDT